MRRIIARVVVVLVTLSLPISLGATGQALSPAEFASPPAEFKVHTWWHWLDGAITREGITKDLEAMKAQGIGQATILNIGLFGGRDFGVPRVKFASEEWFAMFRWALEEANRLGIKIGVHNCDGWSSTGGPWITPEMSMKQLVWTMTLAPGGHPLKINLRKPAELWGFYRDIAVVAIKTDDGPSSFQLADPRITLNDGTDATSLRDGSPTSGVAIRKGDRLVITAASPLAFERIAIHLRRPFMWGDPDQLAVSLAVETSDGGKEYQALKNVTVKGLNTTHLVAVPRAEARFVRLTVTSVSDTDAWIPLQLAELELLGKGEQPLFAPDIPYVLEKTGAVNAADERRFYSAGEAAAPYSVPSTSDVVILTDKVTQDGALKWDAPAGFWRIMRFGYTSTGAMNAPATAEGVGLECDKMDPAALDLHFRSFPEKLVEHAGEFAGNTFKFLLVDSWECAFQNWTARFAEEFEKRRGYSLIPFLPALAGSAVGSRQESEAVLFDFRKTIAELIEQNYYEHFSDLCHEHKLEFHAEVIYGGGAYPPLDVLKATRCVDLPMYEFWAGGNRDSLVEYTPTAGPELNFPSCAVIGYDKPALGSEAYTGFAHYSESPQDLKSFGDRAFCSGINQIILHSYVHQPTDRKAGMTLGQFGAHFNRNNPYWQYASGWLTFQSRVQYALRQGAAAPDVLYYLGDQLPQFYSFGDHNKLPFGYQVNACNFDILQNRVKVVGGKLRMNGRSDYALLTLPVYPAMEMRTLELIERLVKEGAVVYGPKPVEPLGRADWRTNAAAFRESADRIWGTPDSSGVVDHPYGKGRVLWGMPIEGALARIGLAPDLATSQKEDNTFQFIHRKLEDADVYFVANQTKRAVTRELTFRVLGKTAEIWDPETGVVRPVGGARSENGVVHAPVRFSPEQSLLFVFRPPLSTNVSRPPDSPEEAAISDLEVVIEFQPAYPAEIKPIKLTALKPLSEFDDPAIRYFAGDVVYRISFQVPPASLHGNARVMLDLGAFDADGEAALNGKNLGAVWRPETPLDVTGLVGLKNELVVRIATVYRNRFIGDLIQFGAVKTLFTSAPVTDFLSKDKPPKPSGLIGPLKLFRVPTAPAQ
jgi:hypothetical protein